MTITNQRAVQSPPATGAVSSRYRDVDAVAIQPHHILWLLALGAMWGSSYLFIKVLVDAASPSAMIAVRFALGAGVLGGVLWLRGGRLPARGVVWLHLLVMSVGGNVVPFLLIAWSQRHADSSLAAILNATIPFFTLLFAALVFRSDRISGGQVAGIALGFGGVALLTGTSILHLGSAGGLAELALVGSSFCYGFAFAYARRFVRGDPLANVTAQLSMGFLIMTPLALRSGWVRPERLDALDLAAWVALGAAGTGLAYIIYYALIREIGAPRASLVTYIIPVVGVTLGWLLLDERFGRWGFVGMLLIVLGIGVSYGWHRRLLRRRQ